MSDHALLSPSSASRRVACPGSRQLEALYPGFDIDSPASREGTTAHWLCAWWLHVYPDIAEPPADHAGEPITREMIDGAKLYADHILGTCGEGNRSDLQIEKRVDISIIHPECWGTPDCWYYRGDALHIWDYKYGHGLVEAFENWQLIEYAAGILHSLKLLNADRGIYFSSNPKIQVHLHIVQPRNFHHEGPIRSWVTTIGELLEYFRRLRAAEHLAMSLETFCTPSPECTYCTARHACPALQEAALTAVDVAMQNNPHELTAASLGTELRYLRHAAGLLDARLTGLSEQALYAIKRGTRVPGFAIEESAGRERWTIPADEVIAMGELFSHDLRKPAETLTPRQAISAGLPMELVQANVERSRGTLKLVPENVSMARKIFGGNK